MDLKLQQKTYFMLEEKIKQAVIKKQPIEEFVKEQIKLLESVHDNFVSEAKKNNPDVINAAKESYDNYGYGLSSVRFIRLSVFLTSLSLSGLTTLTFSA